MGTVDHQTVYDLSGIMTGLTGKERLAELTKMARQEQKMMSVALYDINGMKRVNELYGHREGDHLLWYISKMMEESLTERDMLFRLDEDKFVLALYDETEDGAVIRINEALRRLERNREKFGIGYEASFCYGVTTVYPTDRYCVTDIIDREDEKMYLQKRSYHIANAGRELLQSPGSGGSLPAFEYDKEHLY